MLVNLRGKIFKAAGWSVIDQVSLQLMQFITFLVMARFITPEDFGLMGMVAIFLAITHIFVDSGLSSAIIQRKNVTALDESSVFYYNVVMGFLSAVLLYCVAPYIATFFDQPRLVSLIRVLSLGLIVHCFSIVHVSLLSKQLNFKKQIKASILSCILSCTIGILFAINGFGLWSLAFQYISNVFFKSISLWYMYSWRPEFRFSIKTLMNMFEFSSRIFASNLLDTLFQNLYTVIIGKLFSASDVGFYTNSRKFQQLPITFISTIVNRITFPVFSTIHENPEQLKDSVRKSFSTLALINLPVMIGLAMVAKPLVIFFLTEKWLPLVPYLQLLCLTGLFHPLQIVNLNILAAKGLSKLLFRLELVKKSMILVSLSITWRWGIEAMLTGQIIVSFAAFLLNSFYTAKIIKYLKIEFFTDLFPSVALSCLMGISVYSVQYFSFNSAFNLLVSQILVGVTIYSMACIYFKVPAFLYIIDMLKNYEK